MANAVQTTALAILAIVAVLALAGLLLLLSGQLTSQVYGGALKDVEYPYLEGRPAKGVPVTPEGIPVADELTASQEGIPYRTYGRTPAHIPTVLSTCGEGSMEVSVNILQQWKDAHPDGMCSDYDPELRLWCCKVPSLNDYS